MVAGFRAVVDVSRQLVTVLYEEIAEFGVVNEPARGGELVPCAGTAGAPILANGLALAGLDRPGCETGLALCDASPDEGRGLLPFPVVQDGLDRAGNWREPADDVVPFSGGQGPVQECLAPVLVVDQAEGSVELQPELAQCPGEVVRSEGCQSSGKVAGGGVLAFPRIEAQVGSGVAD